MLKGSGKMVNSAALRNKDPILQVLKEYITPLVQNGEAYNCLEVSSGSGQHIAHFAKHFPSVIWQPSEFDKSCFDSISAYIEEAGVSNIKQPIYLDICDNYTKWNGGNIGKLSLDFMMNINMIHISPIQCTEGLFQNSGQVLKPGGLLFTYGPYSFHGKISPESNVRFDAMLRSQNPEWGLRDVDHLSALATAAEFHLVNTVALPANNHCLVWKKQK